ncbi:MAG: anhydro-N-acetylmuramic acid kinase [Bacteroidota bacterium]
MKILGLMSGTSLDGLDIALCSFNRNNNGLNSEILHAETVPYDAHWKSSLSEAHTISAENYFALNAQYGAYLGEQINVFLSKHKQSVDAIASHGHTIFHQPHKGFSTQLGCGATIAAQTGIQTVCDFRSLDVALNGQGAPLVPIGDELLFADYEACLNIGGIANISLKQNGKRIAFDICEANMVLNFLAEKLQLPYDENGRISAQGKIDNALLQQLNALSFYLEQGAKSLGREWFDQNIVPFIKISNLSVQDLLATFSEHVSQIIGNTLNHFHITKCLVTGGGAFNGHLIQGIRSKTNCEIILPTKQIINFKEALIFAFLGYLRLNQQVNTLATVTGASANSIGGAVYLGAAV